VELKLSESLRHNTDLTAEAREHFKSNKSSWLK